jgi:hypothetical protein
MGYAEIVGAVRLDGGVKRFPMSTIKQQLAPYRDRLGAALCKEMTGELRSRGILTLPATLPTDEREWVILIDEKSALGDALALATKAMLLSRIGMPMPPGAHEKHKRLARHL